MALPTKTVEVDQALKAKYRATWASGDYPPRPPRSSPTSGPSWSRRAALVPRPGA